MSSPAALATITATLRSLLSGVTASVTTQSPAVARSDKTDQINIFLYNTYYNTAFNNAPMPGRTRNGEHANPPLPLILKYMITAYGANDDDILGQQLMGEAMSILHDHPILGPSDFDGISPNSDLQQQVERVRIIPDALSLDDMSKIWTSFQSAEYQLSTGYEVSVLLIESNRANRTPLPVLKRGAEDQGAIVISASPASLTGLIFPNQKPSVEFGDDITLLGSKLTSNDTVIRFQHPQLDDPIDIQPENTSNRTEMKLRIPALIDDVDLGFKWPAGFYTVSVITQRPDIPAWSSNSVAMPLSPTIESINPTSAAAGDVTLDIECLPQIKSEQTVLLLFGDKTITADSISTPLDPAARTTVVFTVENAIAKTTPYVLRLRVDGVDSIPVDFSGSTPEFLASQQVTIT